MERRESRQPVIFCDFDGTITERDMIMLLLERYGKPGWKDIRDSIVRREISIRDGVSAMFGAIPSSLREDMVQTALADGRIRAGFSDFVAYCSDSNISLLITSGGIDFFVLPMLKPFRLDEIYCNQANFEGPQIKIEWPHGCDEECALDCGMCKPAIMRRYPREQYDRIVIGDSLTDFAAARTADFVIARSYLLEECRQQALPHAPFETFYDVMKVLDERKRGG